MKRVLFSVAILIATFSDGSAKPKLHVSCDFTIGRPRHDCNGVCVCRENFKWEITWEGMIKQGHGFVLDENEGLSIAINEELIKKQDINKFNSLMSGKVVLDSEEELPADLLRKIGYKGSNKFQAGTYSVVRYQGYFLVNL